jgi:phage virion morphogenesis protein
MISIRTVGLTQVKENFEAMGKRCQNPTTMLEVIAQKGRKNVLQHFEKEMGDTGPWKPLSASRAKHKKGGKGKILQDTGRLRLSIRGRTKTNEAHVYTNVEYAKFHEFGIGVPERRFMWLDATTIRNIILMLKNFLVNG